MERTSSTYLDRIVLKREGSVLFLKVDEIDWIEADGDYVKLHVGAGYHLLRETMKSLEEQLDPALFARTHRSLIVNLDRIETLHPGAHGDCTIVLRDSTRLKLSRSRRSIVAERLGRSL